MDELPLQRALESALEEDWESARAALDGVAGPTADGIRAVIRAIESHERARRNAQFEMRHELGNAITIALANIEGMADGAVPVTPKRLQNVCEALRRAQGLLR